MLLRKFIYKPRPRPRFTMEPLLLQPLGTCLQVGVPEGWGWMPNGSTSSTWPPLGGYWQGTFQDFS
jgi:hypothetical protein